ncbi:MAG TPA: TonB-dependent receptor, partial [Puia sp.]|nr:TonB-dependent receptor [Puia sp.]
MLVLHRVLKTMVFLVFVTIAKVNAQETGVIKGKIVEQITKQPVTGATVVIKDLQGGVITDTAGQFVIRNVPEGSYSIIISYVGFQQKVLNDIPVVRAKTYYLETELLDDAGRLGEVTIRAFKGEHNPMVPVSSYSFSREEIFRSPGAQGDIFRAIGILPGVVSSGGQYSAIAVRGQGTSDNVYMADDIPMFQVSHLEIEGFNSGFNDPNGGRFSIFAPRVIDNALFEGGGFGAQYGRKSSSYLGLGIKEGNRETPFLSGQFDLFGATLIYDGPSGLDKKTSLFATGRYQNFYLLEKLLNLSSAGAPSYGDFMIKTTTEINSKNKLSIIAMYNPELFDRKVIDVANSGNVNNDNNSNFVGRSSTSKTILGLNLRTLLNKNSYWKNILYYRTLNVDNNLGFAYPTVNQRGDIVSKDNIPYESDLRHIKNNQAELGYRSIFTRHTKNITITAGIDLARVDLDYARNLKHTDTLYTFGQKDFRADPSQYYIVLQPIDFNSTLKDFALNASGYVDLSFTLFKRLTLNPGLRYDYTGFAKQSTISPRISGSIAIDEKQSINFATGIYYQDPAYADVASQPQGHDLKNERTLQYILGYKIYFSPDLKFTAEGWYKQFDDLAVQPNRGRSYLSNNGTGYAYGADVNLTKRLSKKYYGQVGYSYMLSKRDDHDGLGDYDYIFSVPHTFSVLGSYKPNEKWVFSGKFRYATGRPT